MALRDCADYSDDEDVGQNLDYSDEELIELLKNEEEDNIDLDTLNEDDDARE
jgi:hypothetical protein